MHSVSRMSELFREYLRPLIQGEVKVEFEGGVYKVAKLRLGK